MQHPTDPMTATRRARLFELIRQQSRADHIARQRGAPLPQPPELIYQFRAAAAASLRP